MMFLGIGQNLNFIGLQGFLRQALSGTSTLVITISGTTIDWTGAGSTNTAFTATVSGTTLSWSNA